MHDLNAIFDPDHGQEVPPREAGSISTINAGLDDASIGPDDLPGDWRVEFEERAAILEYEGGMLRERAEAVALAKTIRLMQKN